MAKENTTAAPAAETAEMKSANTIFLPVTALGLKQRTRLSNVKLDGEVFAFEHKDGAGTCPVAELELPPGVVPRAIRQLATTHLALTVEGADVDMGCQVIFKGGVRTLHYSRLPTS